MSNLRRIPELDALRGIAALMVLLFHFSYLFTNKLLPNYIFKYGCAGVDLFFMISGFVIFMSIKPAQNIKDFWFARFNRLFPAYWLSAIIAVLTFYLSAGYHFNTSWNYIFGNLFMVWPLVKTHEILDAYWTLYVELTFYILMSAVIAFKLIQHIEKIIWIGLAAIIIINGGFLFFPDNRTYLRFFIIAREVFPMISYLPFFASGILYYKIYGEGLSAGRAILLAICFCTIALTNTTGARFVFFFNSFERLACAAVFNLLFYLIITNKAHLLRAKILIWAGAISYPLYLLHQAIGYKMAEVLRPIDTNLAVIGGISISVIAACVVAYLIEPPIRSWLKRAHNYSETTAKQQQSHRQ